MQQMLNLEMLFRLGELVCNMVITNQFIQNQELLMITNHQSKKAKSLNIEIEIDFAFQVAQDGYDYKKGRFSYKTFTINGKKTNFSLHNIKKEPLKLNIKQLRLL